MKVIRYKSRFKAGEILAKFIEDKRNTLRKLILKKPSQFFCFAIPNGGVPVVERFCSKLNLVYDILIVRKIKIPYNTEAGFGSVTTDGSVLINDPLLSRLNLSEQEVKNSVELTKSEIRDRLNFYNKDLILDEFYEQNIENKHVFIFDNGLASGFTMLAAINMIKKYDPKKIFKENKKKGN